MVDSLRTTVILYTIGVICCIFVLWYFVRLIQLFKYDKLSASIILAGLLFAIGFMILIFFG